MNSQRREIINMKKKHTIDYCKLLRYVISSLHPQSLQYEEQCAKRNNLIVYTLHVITRRVEQN